MAELQRELEDTWEEEEGKEAKSNRQKEKAHGARKRSRKRPTTLHSTNHGKMRVAREIRNAHEERGRIGGNQKILDRP